MVIRSLAQKRQMQQQNQAGNAHRMANKMRRYFAPASTFQPPNSVRGQTGNRNTTSSANLASNTAPTDNAVLQFIPNTGGAIAVWRFTPGRFTNQPTVVPVAITQSLTGSPQELTLANFTSARNGGGGAGVTIQSSDPLDARFINVHAIGVFANGTY